MMSSRWFKIAKRERDVKIGSVFRHRLAGNATETATVLGVEEDFMGIPHVIYDLRVEKFQKAAYRDRRTLALESFSDYFEESLTA
jgi:hypothetical protein